MPPLRLWKKWLSATFSSSRRESLYVFCPYSDLTLVKHTVPAFTGIFYTCQPQDGSSSYFPAPFSLYAVYLQQRLAYILIHQRPHTGGIPQRIGVLQSFSVFSVMRPPSPLSYPACRHPAGSPFGIFRRKIPPSC